MLIDYARESQVRLVSILEEYKLTRQQKEEEKKRFRVLSFLLNY